MQWRDSFDAMTSKRSYRQALSLEEAIVQLKEGSGTQFDPEVVKAFLPIAGYFIEDPEKK